MEGTKLICPRCGRQNPDDALFCNRCGVRVRSGGVSYRSRHGESPMGGGSQVLLGLAMVLLAGVVLGGGAFVLLRSNPGVPPTDVAVVPTLTPSGGLETFVQPTASPSPSPSPTPSPSALFSPTPLLSPTLPLDTPSPTPATPAPTATPRPRPTPTPAPEATPVNCEAATGTPDRTVVIGLGNASQATPETRAWCVDVVTTRIVFGSTFGTARLMRGNRTLVEVNCVPGNCQQVYERIFPDPRLVRPGQTLRYEFTCTGDPATPDDDECSDGTPDGATFEIGYERISVP